MTEESLAKRREYQRQYRARERREKPEHARAIKRASYAKHAEEINKRKRETRDEWEILKNSARCKVTKAIRRGDLVRGECEVGDDCFGEIQAHHDDYSQPLEVRWLCKSHHMKLHAEDWTGGYS